MERKKKIGMDTSAAPAAVEAVAYLIMQKLSRYQRDRSGFFFLLPFLSFPSRFFRWPSAHAKGNAKKEEEEEEEIKKYTPT